MLVLVLLISMETHATIKFQVHSGLWCEDTQQPLVGSLDIYSGSRAIASYQTDDLGRFPVFSLPLFSRYKFVFSSEGYISKFADVRATIDSRFDGIWDYKDTTLLYLECSLFKSASEDFFDFLKEEPMIIFELDDYAWLQYDRRYVQVMQKKVLMAKERAGRFSRVNEVDESLTENGNNFTEMAPPENSSTQDAENFRAVAPQKIGTANPKRLRKSIRRT